MALRSDAFGINIFVHLDFADALVLSSAHGHNSVATFDKDFAKVAGKLKAKPEVIYRS